MTRPRLPLAVGLVLAVVAVAGCALPTDKAPRAINPAKVPSILSAPEPATSIASGPGRYPLHLFFVSDTKIVEVKRMVHSNPNTRSALEALLAGPTTEEKSRGITSQIPPDTKILGLSITSDHVLDVNLSKEINQIGGTTSKTAYAQLVFTLTSIVGINRVSFFTEGDQVAAPTDQGNVTVVQASDYSNDLTTGGG